MCWVYFTQSLFLAATVETSKSLRDNFCIVARTFIATRWNDFTISVRGVKATVKSIASQRQIEAQAANESKVRSSTRCKIIVQFKANFW